MREPRRAERRRPVADIVVLHRRLRLCPWRSYATNGEPLVIYAEEIALIDPVITCPLRRAGVMAAVTQTVMGPSHWTGKWC